jgi:hypothetical protein
VVGPYLVCGAWFPSHLPLEGTGSYPDFWALTGGPRYSGYNTPVVAPEPSVERVAGAIRSMGGRMGTHMLLRILLQDLVVWPWG